MKAVGKEHYEDQSPERRLFTLWSVVASQKGTYPRMPCMSQPLVGYAAPSEAPAQGEGGGEWLKSNLQSRPSPARRNSFGSLRKKISTLISQLGAISGIAAVVGDFLPMAIPSFPSTGYACWRHGSETRRTGIQTVHRA